MWHPFKKKYDVKRPGIAAFQRTNNFAITYERQRLPDPGASVYSYETLGLEGYTPIGAGVAVRRHFKETTTPVYIPGPAVPLTGMPTVAGQFVHVPLISQPVVQ